MAKTKILNGLSYSLAHSYFSTINYYSKGYMSDWIVNSAYELGIDSVKIDVMRNEITPKELMIRPLLCNLPYLKYIINKTLKSNNLPEDFIQEVKLDIKITQERQIVCSGYTKGINGRVYKSKEFVDQSFTEFKALNLSTKDKIKEKAATMIGRFLFFLWRKFSIGQLRYEKRIDHK